MVGGTDIGKFLRFSQAAPAEAVLCGFRDSNCGIVTLRYVAASRLSADLDRSQPLVEVALQHIFFNKVSSMVPETVQKGLRREIAERQRCMLGNSRGRLKAKDAILLVELIEARIEPYRHGDASASAAAGASFDAAEIYPSPEESSLLGAAPNLGMMRFP